MRAKNICKKYCTNTNCSYNLLPEMYRFIPYSTLRLMVQTGFLSAYHLDPNFERDGIIIRFFMPKNHPNFDENDSIRAFFAWEIEHTCLLEFTPLYTPEDPMPIDKIASVLRCSKSTVFEILSTAIEHLKDGLKQQLEDDFSKIF